MKWLICLLNLIFLEWNRTASSKSLFRTSRITHGELVDHGKYPFIVSIQRNGSHFCSGSIITEDSILTAVHCLLFQSDPIASLSVLAGTSDLLKQPATAQRRSLKRIIINKNYSSKDVKDVGNDDLAVLKLTTPLNLNADASIKRIALLKQTEIKKKPDEMIVAGWGSHIMSEPFVTSLFETSVKLVSNDYCSTLHRKVWNNDKVLCAKDDTTNEACRGDLGSPLFFTDETGRHVQVGVMSYGVPCGLVYTRVSFYLTWIIKNSR